MLQICASQLLQSYGSTAYGKLADYSFITVSMYAQYLCMQQHKKQDNNTNQHLVQTFLDLAISKELRSFSG